MNASVDNRESQFNEETKSQMFLVGLAYFLSSHESKRNFREKEKFCEDEWCR